MTGHQVLTSLHTRDALSAVVRLNETGLPMWQIRDVLSGVVAQRLVRRICPHCKTHRLPTAAEQKAWGLSQDQPVYFGKGCDYCGQTGYYGRFGVFEILHCDDTFKQHWQEGMTRSDLAAFAPNFDSLRDNVRRAIIDGETSIEEGQRIV